MTFALGFCLLFISCASTNATSSNGLCLKEKIITTDFSDIQKNYTLKIPSNWVGFFDTHCVFSYKPKKSVKQKPYIVVFVLDEAHLSLNDNIHNLEDFTNDFVKNILAKNSDPKLTVIYQEHTLYKKYSIVNYKTSFLGNTYTSLNVSFYYNSRPYRITYFAEKGQFPNYLEDFTSMLETFRITE
ncbi:MAG: hypothetical protein ABF265_06950 [Polaribacter sp.]